jgi:hypothetical protein
MRAPTAAQFASALKGMNLPGGSQLKFLQAHFDSPVRSATATKLAKAARYKDFRGVNVCYGRLAKRIGNQLKRPGESLTLLVEFIKPNAVTNKDYVLVMRPEFAEGLAAAGWVK